MHQALETRGALARGCLGIVVLVSLVVLFTPGSGVPAAPAGVDKLVHGLLFTALALSGRWAGVRRGALVCVLMAYGAGSEVVQGMAALARSATVGDWLADVTGVLLGSTLWDVAVRRRRAAQ